MVSARQTAANVLPTPPLPLVIAIFNVFDFLNYCSRRSMPAPANKGFCLCETYLLLELFDAFVDLGQGILERLGLLF